ncbi:uncharacterized protein LOC105665392 [Ceratitis capitata]|uniref:Uncharacterized protein n=1 Tax=Ceratitis capitata TaxID=7213 RepID=W8AWF2_CERCA|nr:uncharacterized protein LOC105665392 [Ceratitis capitata]XP_020717344.1 uncharacterized protein LOC105665392 [Ceratitis capitata]
MFFVSKTTSNRLHCRFAAAKILFLFTLCVYSLVSVPRFAHAIESLEEPSAASNSVEDNEESFVADTLLAKDTVLKKNPANIGNKLKELWEQIPEHTLNAVDIKK